MVRNVWTKQQEDFIRKNFNNVNSAEELYKIFNATFETNVGKSAIRHKANRMGLSFINKGLADVKDYKQSDVDKTIRESKEQETLNKMLHLEEDNSFLRKQVKKMSKLSGMDKRILDKFEEICCHAPERKKVEKYNIHKNEKTNQDALMVISDTHLEETVNREAMIDLNEYSTKIFSKRMQMFTDKALDIFINKMIGYKFSKLNVAFMGDMATGDIHEELKSTNEVPSLEAALIGADVFGMMLRELAQHFDIRMWGVCGNHTRQTKKPSFKNKWNSLDWLMYQIIKRNVMDVPNIKCELSKSLIEIKNIQGNNYKFTHGNEIKGGQSGLPFYGSFHSDDKITGTLLQQGITYNDSFLGHFHTYASIPRKAGGSIWFCGAGVGATEYSLGSMGLASPASQFICGIHKDHSVVHPFNITLQNADKEIKDSNMRYHYALK